MSNEDSLGDNMAQNSQMDEIRYVISAAERRLSLPHPSKPVERLILSNQCSSKRFVSMAFSLPLLLGYASNVKWYAITSGGNCLNAQNGRSNSQGLSVNAWETTSVSAAHTNVAWITGGRDYGTWDYETCRSSDRGRDNKFWTHIRQLEWNVETPGRHKEDSAFLHLTLRLYLVIREERLHRSRMSIKS